MLSIDISVFVSAWISFASRKVLQVMIMSTSFMCDYSKVNKFSNWLNFTIEFCLNWHQYSAYSLPFNQFTTCNWHSSQCSLFAIEKSFVTHRKIPTTYKYEICISSLINIARDCRFMHISNCYKKTCMFLLFVPQHRMTV